MMNEIRRAQPLLGTLVEITLRGMIEPEQLLSIANQAFAVVRRVHNLMSIHSPDSELCRLNRMAANEAVHVDPWTWEVLKAASQVHIDSNGSFDPAVGSTLMNWGLRPTLSMKSLHSRGTMSDVHLSTNHQVSYRQVLALDLGGIAKGFAVDQAVTLLSTHPKLGGVVNAGGDLRVFGDTAQRVEIRHPGRPDQSMIRLSMQNRSMATSGTYFSSNWHGGIRRSHLVRTGRIPASVDATSSITVISSSCMIADALTKPGFVMPRSEFQHLLSRYDCIALIAHADGTYEEIE